MKDETMQCGSEVSITVAMRVLILLVATLVIVEGIDDDGGTYVPGDEGRYFPDNSGEYIPDYSGRYIHDPSGNYKDDGTGRFSGNQNALLGGKARSFVDTTTLARKTLPTVPPVTTSTTYVTTRGVPQGKWKIIRQVSETDLDGYHWEYETENNIIAEETGKLSNKGTDLEALRAKGFFKYTGPDNVVYSVSYTADENGFVAEGKHLPTEPPIPEEILRALEKQKSIEAK